MAPCWFFEVLRRKVCHLTLDFTSSCSPEKDEKQHLHLHDDDDDDLCWVTQKLKSSEHQLWYVIIIKMISWYMIKRPHKYSLLVSLCSVLMSVYNNYKKHTMNEQKYLHVHTKQKYKMWLLLSHSLGNAMKRVAYRCGITTCHRNRSDLPSDTETDPAAFLVLVV